jgi:hypothetical protein
MSSDEIKTEVKKFKPSICRYNTSCKFETCNKEHAIPYHLRLKIIKIIEDNPEFHELHSKEDFPLMRIAPCRFGQLCIKEDCTFKHGMNPEGRKKISKEFRSSKPYVKK